MYDESTGKASWSDDGGTLFVDFNTGECNDSLDHEAIVESYEHGSALPPCAPDLQQEYERIGFELLDDGADGDHLGWGMDYTDDGRGVRYSDGNSWVLVMHPDGVRFGTNYTL